MRQAQVVVGGAVGGCDSGHQRMLQLGAIAPSKGRIQMSKTNDLQTFITDLQRTAVEPFEGEPDGGQ